MRYLLHFSYNGSYFYGFSKQVDKKTIQGEIEKLLNKRFNCDVKITGCGRTDKGVHSLDHYAHFDVEKDFDVEKLKTYLNNFLRGEIYIKSINRVNKEFHARYNVKKKTYLYIINTGEYNPTEKDTVFQYNKKINLNLLKKASKKFVGNHSFKAFTPASNKLGNYNRSIYNFKIIKKHNYVCIYITGSGFLRYMVRNIVGLLIDINEGKKEINDIIKMFDTGVKENNCNIANSEGLYLYRVYY